MEEALGTWKAAVPGRNCGIRAQNLSGERFGQGEALAAALVQELLPNYRSDCSPAPGLIKSNQTAGEGPGGGGAGWDPPGRSKSRHIPGWRAGRVQVLVQSVGEGLELHSGGI